HRAARTAIHAADVPVQDFAARVQGAARVGATRQTKIGSDKGGVCRDVCITHQHGAGVYAEVLRVIGAGDDRLGGVVDREAFNVAYPGVARRVGGQPADIRVASGEIVVGC